MGFKQYYDLVFRARNARLQSVCFQLEFLNWIKAGVAFNTRGSEISTRKIAMFAELYKILARCRSEGAAPIEENVFKFKDALVYFYEDIYSIYQDHLASKQMEVKMKELKAAPEFNQVLIVPSFKETPWLSDVFRSVSEVLETYECKHEHAFANSIVSPYLKKDTELYKGMAMMFDYGPQRMGRDVLLGVTLWGEEM